MMNAVVGERDKRYLRPFSGQPIIFTVSFCYRLFGCILAREYGVTALDLHL